MLLGGGDLRLLSLPLWPILMWHRRAASCLLGGVLTGFFATSHRLHQPHPTHHLIKPEVYC